MPQIAAFQHTLPVLTCLPCHFLGSGKSFCVSHCQTAVILHRLLFYPFMCSIYISHLWINPNLSWPFFLYRRNLRQALGPLVNYATQKYHFSGSLQAFLYSLGHFELMLLSGRGFVNVSPYILFAANRLGDP